jgi:hypothetical protein
MTNLTDKLTTLGSQLTAQHVALMAKLDTIISKLGDVNTTLTANGSFDTTPITTAITNLRGTGPENTLKSVNQSIWNIAGTAPGASLLELLDAINLLRGPAPATGAPDLRVDMVMLKAAIVALGAGWDPGTGGSPYALLSSINAALGGDPYNSLEIASVRGFLNNIMNGNSAAGDLLTRLVAQFDTSVVTPTMKDLMLTMNTNVAIIANNTANPLTAAPVGACDSPLISNGSFYVDTNLVFITPVTVAIWPSTPGGDFTVSYDAVMDAYPILHCTDWTAYRIYVASKSDTFGAANGRGNRYPCNQWITLSIPESIVGLSGAAFNVDRSSGLTVYICPADPLLGSCASGYSDPLIPSGWSVPGQTATYYGRNVYYEMNGYNNGGITWSMDVVIPYIAEDSQSYDIGAFQIVANGNTSLNISWSGVRPDGNEGLRLRQYTLTYGTLWAASIVWASSGSMGAENIIVPGGSQYAYHITAVYSVDPAPDGLPTATVTICN